ncbi:hypothetical protein Acr_00g0041140 [Actinidia rufa]|uniref:Uncharacterized protein n=1 Tax=Actinidia rufa TaxID=165716 RepID=A0A7J0DHW7_9ERIC|nr:hypothetical protein Acr_00g0041140 [Actinidia rufa]
MVVTSATGYEYAPKLDRYSPKLEVEKPNTNGYGDALKSKVEKSKTNEVEKPKTNGYGDAPKPKVEKPNTNSYGDVPKLEVEKSKTNDYEYALKPEVEKPKTYSYGDASKPKVEKSKTNGYGNGPKPEVEKIKASGYAYVPKSEVEKLKKNGSGYTPKSEVGKPKTEGYGYAPKPEVENLKTNGYGYVPKPILEKPKDARKVAPLHHWHSRANLFSGGRTYCCQCAGIRLRRQVWSTPREAKGEDNLAGALAKITCLAMDKNGYESAPFSVLSPPTDAKGYFLTTVSPSELEDAWKLTKCKAFLEKSPLDSCNVPTDMNNGIRGAFLSSFRLLEDKNMKLSSVGPFIYTPEPKPISNGY